MDHDTSQAFTEANSDDEMESLMLCDNENDENSDNEDKAPKISKKQAKKLLSDSEDEQENDEKQEETEPEVQKKKKISTLIDSDSESEVHEETKDDEKSSENEKSFFTKSKDKKLLSGSEDEQEKQSEIVTKKKFSALIDSDSEPEVQNETKNSSDDENSDGKTKFSASPKKKSKQKKKKKEKSKSNDILAGLNLDFGSDSDNSIAGSEKSLSKNSDSDGELSGDEFIRQAGEANGHPDEPKKQRISAKEAMENMKIIQSESQRMAREAYVDIPYHKPKQHSLKEFLSRKSVTRREIPKVCVKTTAASIKMSQEELEEYEKLLKEREKEAAEFFKSESEPEEEEETIPETEKKQEEEQKTQEIIEKSNAELLKEMDEALSNVFEQQDDILSMIDKKNIEETEVSEMEMTEESKIQEEKDETIEETIETLVEEEIHTEIVPETEISPPKELQKSPEHQISAKIEAKRNKLRSLLGDLPEIKPIFADPTLVIDLETGDVVKKELSGPELLKEKYLKNAIVKSQVPHDQDLAIISMENGLHVEHVMLKPNIDTLKVKKDVKPGAAYVKLKEELQKKINESRLKVVQERECYTKKLEDEKAQYSGEEEDEEDDFEDETEVVEEENEVKTSENKEMEVDDMQETEENDVENESESSEDDSSSSEEEDLPEVTQGNAKKNRIIKAFEDSDDETSEKPTEISVNDLSLSDSLPLGQVLPPETYLDASITSETSFKVPETPKETLWENEKDEEDLSALCSGQFGVTQAAPEMPETENDDIKALCDDKNDHEDDLTDLCSGTFVTQLPQNTENGEKTENEADKTNKPSPEKVILGKRNVILSSDEENDEKLEEKLSPKKIKKLKKKKKRRVALEISDDESDEEEEEEESEDEIEQEIEDPEEAEVFLDYDSEENEIEVKLTKEDRQKVATNYFEAEAELSGDEVGSADEDEKDLDRFDIELGDEDQFDQDQLQSELGKIHMRRVLDQDNREVKLLQEMFFEDEEKDGVGRTRKFMWKNVDGVINLMEGVTNDDENAGQHHSDEENEEEYRKMRYEREALLAKNNEEKENSLQLTLESTNETNLLQKTETQIVKKRLTIIKKTLNTSNDFTNKNSDSPFLISFDKVHKESRASFLARDEETLTKLAGMVKEKDGEAISTALGKAKNFVFSVVTPPPQAKQGNKRPSDAAGTDETQNKRQKVEKSDKFKKRLLDSLV